MTRLVLSLHSPVHSLHRAEVMCFAATLTADSLLKVPQLLGQIGIPLVLAIAGGNYTKRCVTSDGLS